MVILILQSIISAAHGKPVKSECQVCKCSEKGKLRYTKIKAGVDDIYKQIDAMRFTGAEIDCVNEIADMALRIIDVDYDVQEISKKGLCTLYETCATFS